MKYRKILIICLLLAVTLDNYAQQKFPGAQPGYNTPDPNAFVDVQSPTAASLGKYGEEDVSFFTGSPNISIPLYTLNVRGVKMPMTLDYDAKGVMPNSLPSYAGQNWTLNMGGVITRTVKGRYDEWIFPKKYVDQKSIKRYNYFQNHKKLKEYLAEGGNYSELKKNASSPEYDISPDEFTFHFMGKSGKFFLDQDGSWRVLSDDNLEVIFDYNKSSNFIGSLFDKYPNKTSNSGEQSKTIAGFVIRDDEGNSYTFGYNKNAIEYTTNIWHMSEGEDCETWHASCWYLTKVTDKYGNDLYKFSYVRGCYVIQVFNCYYSDTVDEKASGFLGASDYFTMTNSHFPYTISISSPVYLKNIQAMNGIYVDISSSNVGNNLATETLYKKLFEGRDAQYLYYYLSSMVSGWRYPESSMGLPTGAFYYLQSDDNDSLKDWRYPSSDVLNILSRSRIRKLNYITIDCNKIIPTKNNYIGFRFCMSDSGNRLKLDSLMIQDNSVHYSSKTGVNGVFRFKYNQFDKLPSDYLTTEVDHWGYYNGNPYKINNYTYATDMISARNPNSAYTPIGILNEIVYPTGGVTVYEYEPNDYSLVLSNDRQSVSYKNGIGGGLRIKSIKTFDSTDKKELLHQKEYSYIDPLTGKSSGELFAVPMYNWNWRLKCEFKNASYKLNTVHTASIVPLANGTGVSLGYSCVTEKIKDNTNTNNTIEKHIYRYTNISDSAVRGKRFTLTFGYANQYTPFDEWSELSFKKGLLISEEIYDGENTLKSKTNYNYRSDDCLNKYVLTSNLIYECYGNSAQYQHYLGGIYKLFYPKYDLVKLTEYDYSNGQSIPMVTTRSYDKSDITFTSYRPYRHEVDLRILNSESITRGIFKESNEYTFGDFKAKNGNDSILYKGMFFIKPYKIRYTRNEQMISESNIVYSNPQQFKINGKNTLMPIMVTNKNLYNIVDTVLSYSSYTSTGMPLIFKKKGQPTTYLKWAYKDCYLVISGNSYMPFSVSDKTFLDQKTCLSYLTSCLKGYPDCQLKGYVWYPLFGITDIILPNGNVTSYTYNSFGQLTKIYDYNKVLTNEYEYNYRK